MDAVKFGKWLLFLVCYCFDKVRINLTQFRLSNHNLEIESGRITGVDRKDRICKLCPQNLIENEYHFLLCCSKYRTLRNKYIPNSAWPSIEKFNHLLRSTNKKSIINTAKFLSEALLLRKNYLQNDDDE